MGLEFLREHGACRLRRNLDQLPIPEAQQPDGDAEERPEPNLDFEVARDDWKAIPVENDLLAPELMPQRFIDGSHLGHTVAWLRDAECRPVPVRLAEIGGVCMRADGRTLRREFGIVERVVAMVIDPFPWHEVESFAAALTATGLRLLPATILPNGEAGPAAGFDFETFRERARVRAQHEMEVLEELALCQDIETPSLVDGRLGRFQQSGLRDRSVVGVIKQQRGDYLHPRGWQLLYDLEPGQRTPAFTLPSKNLPVVSWYLKLDGAWGALPNWGIVRVEIPVGHFNRNRCSFRYLNRLSSSLFHLRCRQSVYRRAPVSLEPIVRAEESLKSLFSPASMLVQRFYHLTGL
jgi:hypothetical protein